MVLISICCVIICLSVLGKRVLKALYDYDSRMEGDLSFRKGDEMELVDDQSDESWWLARHADGSEGYVPSNYVALQDTIESQE